MKDHPILKIPRKKLNARQVAQLMVDITTCEDPEMKQRLIAYNNSGNPENTLKKTFIKRGAK